VWPPRWFLTPPLSPSRLSPSINAKLRDIQATTAANQAALAKEQRDLASRRVALDKENEATRAVLEKDRVKMVADGR
jgi:hypothetical protein